MTEQVADVPTGIAHGLRRSMTAPVLPSGMEQVAYVPTIPLALHGGHQ